MRLALVLIALAACEQPSPEAGPAPAPAPAIAPRPAPPAPVVTGGLHFVERRGDTDLRHGGLMAIGLARSGRYAASGSMYGSAAAWDLRDGRVLAWIHTPHGNVWTVAVSSDGTRLATSGHDGTTRMWDVARGVQLWESALDADRLQFTDDGARLVGRRFHTYRAWSAHDGTLLHSDRPVRDDLTPERAYAMTSDAATSLVLEPTGVREEQMGCVSREVAGGYAVASYEVGPRRHLVRFAAGGSDAGAVFVSPDALRIGVLGREHLEVFTAVGTRLARLHTAAHHPVHERTQVLLATPRIALTWDDKQIVAWDLTTSRQLWRAPGGAYREPQLAGGDVVITASEGRCVARRVGDGVQLWQLPGCMAVAAWPASPAVFLQRGASALDAVDARMGTPLLARAAQPGPLGAITQLAVSRDGARVAGFGDTLWAWDATTSRRLVDPPRLVWRPVLQFLASGRLAVVDEGADHARLIRYDVDRNAIEASRELRVNGRTSGGRLLSGDEVIVAEVREHDYVFTAFDLEDRRGPRTLPPWKRPANRQRLAMRNESLYQAVSDPVGQRMFVAGDENFIRAWDVRTGKLLASSAESHGFVRQLVLTPDRTRVIVPRETGPIVVLDAATLREQRRLVGPTRYVTMAAASPDSAVVAVAALDGLFVWRLSDGARIATVDFTRSREAPMSVAFSPDGATLWVGTDVGSLLRFRVGP